MRIEVEIDEDTAMWVLAVLVSALLPLVAYIVLDIVRGQLP